MHTPQPTGTQDSQSFFSLVRHPFKFRLYLLKNLPSAYFSGLRIINADADSSRVVVPYKWFTRNPFRSTYFACLSMAAELSTGVLAMAQVYGRRPGISMLVVSMEAKFYKKATGQTIFECTDGTAIKAAVATATKSGEATLVKAHSVGRSQSEEIVAEFWITWSFKLKTR